MAKGFCWSSLCFLSTASEGHIMVLEGLCLTRRGAGDLIMAWGPLARLLLAWTALSCVAGVQGHWDGAVEPAGPGRVRRRGSPGILQGCVVLRMLRGPSGVGWVRLSFWVGGDKAQGTSR